MRAGNSSGVLEGRRGKKAKWGWIIISGIVAVILILIYWFVVPVWYYNKAKEASEWNDSDEAIKYYQKAAKFGHANSQYKLGQIFYDEAVLRSVFDMGGDRESYLCAVRCFRNAAEQGHADAQFRLGELFLKGVFLSQSDEKAFTWFQKAAKQGHAGAQYNLGRMYLTGRGVSLDTDEGGRLIRKAAAQGNDEAKRFLSGEETDWGQGNDFQQSAKQSVEE